MFLHVYKRIILFKENFMPGEITIKSGDTLSQIAIKNGISVKELMDANGIKNADDIKSGQKITIPITTAKPAAPTDSFKAKAPNATMAEMKFSEEEIASNKKYSNEKIKKSYETNPDLKSQAASLSTDPYSGYVSIKLKSDRTANDLKKLYNIPDGVLKKYNDLSFEWKELPDGHHQMDYGNPTFEKGSTVIVPPGSFEYGGAVKELWNALTK